MATSGSPSLDVNTIATVVAGVVSSLQSQAPSTHAHDLVNLQSDLVNLQSDIVNLQSDLVNLQSDLVNPRRNLVQHKFSKL